MRLSPPVPWRDVPRGAVVLFGGVCRTVLANRPSTHAPGRERFLLLEGCAPSHAFSDGPYGTVQLVLLDEADAITTLAAAGLNPEVLD